MKFADAHRLGKYAEFHKLWLRNGGSLAFAKYPRSKMSKIHATLLDNWSAQADTPSQTLTIATDGSGRRDGRAGYGVTARWLAPDEDPSLCLFVAKHRQHPQAVVDSALRRRLA